MKAPVQCALWAKPELANTPDFFEVLETYGDETHWTRYLLQCRECGQRYIYDFYEEVNFSGGEDDQSVAYVPVETAADIEALKDALAYEFHHFHPRLAKDFTAGKIFWVTK